MSIDKTLHERSESKCELCTAENNLSVYEVPPAESNADKCILACEKCNAQLLANEDLDANHWRCLNDSMWSSVPAVQVVAYRQLNKLYKQHSQDWANDLLDMMYLEDEVKTWAEQGIAAEEADSDVTLDSNGSVLQAGDTVTLIKDLDVKGAGFTAKRGTAVRGISLTNSTDAIEGRVNGTRIVLLTKFLKKSN